MEVDIHSRTKETLVVIFNFDPPLKEDNARFTSEPFEIFINKNYAENIVVYFSQLFFIVSEERYSQVTSIQKPKSKKSICKNTNRD